MKRNSNVVRLYLGVESLLGPSIKYPPRFLVGLVQKTRTKAPCTNSVSIVRGGFSPGFLSGVLLSGRFCPRWFLSVPPSVRIHVFQQKVKHHFEFHVSCV